MANATMTKFGYPHTLVAMTDSWCIQLRPQQPTFGSLVLVCREPATAFGQVSPAAFADLQRVVKTLETMLKTVTDYQKINYLMLMMVDPDVHFHVIPRYSGTRRFQGVDCAELEFPDTGWPGPPALAAAVSLDAAQQAALVAVLAAAWTEAAQAGTVA